MGKRGNRKENDTESRVAALRRKVDRQLERHAERLASQLDAHAREKRLLFFFDGMVRYFPYSFRNQMLIREQRPYATIVRTRRVWE